MISTRDATTPTPDPAKVLAKAPSCPFCRSAVVSTNGKTASDSSYWRCDTCGQIWNPTRLVNKPAPPRLW
jgi:transcription elongation factor Elf1